MNFPPSVRISVVFRHKGPKVMIKSVYFGGPEKLIGAGLVQ